MRRVSFPNIEPIRSRTDTDFSVTDETSLFFASCKVNDVNVVRLLINADKTLPRAVRKGTTPLHVAVRASSNEAAAIILQIDPGVSVLRDKAGFTPFARAAEAGNVEGLRQLLAIRPDSIRDRDSSMFTPLHRSAGNGRVAACAFLINNGAQLDATDNKSEETPLFHACRVGSSEVVKVLLECGANINALNYAESTCVFTCIQSMADSIGDSMNVLELLIVEGAKLDIRNSLNQTPLTLAIILRCAKAVACLLRAGANPDFPSKGGRSPLEEVLVNEDVEMIKAFKIGMGEEKVTLRLCDLSAKLDPQYIVGKHLFIVGVGKGFCVEAFRPILGLFGTLIHTIRLEKTGEEKSLLLRRSGVNGADFYLEPDQNFEKPLLVTFA